MVADPHVAAFPKAVLYPAIKYANYHYVILEILQCTLSNKGNFIRMSFSIMSADLKSRLDTKLGANILRERFINNCTHLRGYRMARLK